MPTSKEDLQQQLAALQAEYQTLASVEQTVETAARLEALRFEYAQTEQAIATATNDAAGAVASTPTPVEDVVEEDLTADAISTWVGGAYIVMRVTLPADTPTVNLWVPFNDGVSVKVKDGTLIAIPKESRHMYRGLTYVSVAEDKTATLSIA